MKITYKEIDIYYETLGAGKTIVLLHGFLHSSKMWTDYANIWKSKFNVIKIDLPGHGKSGVVKDVSIPEMALIVHKVLEYEKITTATIIGHSMGGYTGLSFAELFPEKLDKLVLLHSSAYEDTLAVKKRRNLSIKILERHPAMFVRSTIEFLYRKENLEKLKESIESDIADAKKVGYEGYAEATKAMRDRTDTCNVLQSELPTYIVAGEFDKVIEKEISQKQFDLLKNGSGVFLQQSSHMGFMEEKEKCFTRLNEFISS